MSASRETIFANLFALLQGIKQPPVDFTASATPFGTGDGVTPDFTLVGTNGEPLLSTAIVTGLHQTDWQGRQLLYTTPRTNNIAPSDAFGGPLPNTTTGLSVVQSSTKVGGTGPNYVAFTRTDTGSSRSYIACTMSCVVGDVFTYRVWLRSDPTNGNGATAVGIYCASWGQPGCSTCSVLVGGGLVTVVNSYGGGALWTINGIPSNTDILVEVTRTIASADGPSAKAFAYFGGVPAVTPGVVMLGAAPSFSKNQPAGAYIPTTTAPVTVTDYTQAGNQITFGQVPAVGAVEDWDGTSTVASTVPLFTTSSRRLKNVQDVAPEDFPAAFQLQGNQTLQYQGGMPTKGTWEASWLLYSYSDDPNVAPSSGLNAMVDAALAALKPADGPIVRNTLGGTVEYAAAEGNIEIFEGVLDDRAVAVVPIKILVPGF